MLASCRAKLSTRANDIAHYNTVYVLLCLICGLNSRCHAQAGCPASCDVPNCCTAPVQYEPATECQCQCDTCTGPRDCCSTLCTRCEPQITQVVYVPYPYPVMIEPTTTTRTTTRTTTTPTTTTTTTPTPVKMNCYSMPAPAVVKCQPSCVTTRRPMCKIIPCVPKVSTYVCNPCPIRFPAPPALPAFSAAVRDCAPYAAPADQRGLSGTGGADVLGGGGLDAFGGPSGPGGPGEGEGCSQRNAANDCNKRRRYGPTDGVQDNLMNSKIFMQFRKMKPIFG